MKRSLLLLWCIFGLSLITQAQTVQDYIDAHAAVAQQLMREKKVPASIILGVAIHESAAGKSKIARYLNNHFGVKGKNSNTEIRSAYRDYENVEASYDHFTEYLITKTAYNHLLGKFSTADYNGWARGIQRGGYAASRTWASQVISLIKKYKLYEYDDQPGVVAGEVPIAEGQAILATPEIIVKEPEKTGASRRSRIYIVKKKDNLNLISKRLGVSVERLRSKNSLRTIILQPGQKLKY